MKILYITYQVCFALPILLVLTILTALVTIIGSLIGGGAYLGGTIPVKSGHSSSAIYCLFRWRYMEGRKYTNVLPTCLCPITKVPSTYS